MNKAIILGRLGADPEVKSFESGNSIVTLSVATTHKIYNKETEGYDKATAWHRVKAFGKKGEVIAKYLGKGDQIYLEGRIDYRTWDREDGSKGYSTDIVIQDFEFVGGKRSESQGGDVPNQAPSFDQSEDVPW